MTARRNPAMALLFVMLTCVAISSVAESDPRALVSQVVNNELHAQNHVAYWRYRETGKKGGKTQVKEVVETPECWLSWPMSYNGNPPTSAQQAQARQQLDKLVHDRSACRKNRAAIDQDDRKSEALMKILPNAFLFTNEGSQDGKIRLKFRPNPQFHPSTREAKVFHNMQGELVIDQKETRLVSISGRLMNDVNFGGGILAKLRKGGIFHVEQKEVAPSDWEVSLLDVHIAGHALLFKTISEQQQQVNADFRPLPSGMSLAQAASLLEKTINASASTSSGSL